MELDGCEVRVFKSEEKKQEPATEIGSINTFVESQQNEMQL